VPLNILETETHYEAHLYASGFSKENIRLSIADDVLLISGTRTVDEGNLPNFIFQEFPIRSFERVIHLRGQVDVTNITAKQEDGILKIQLPKTPAAQKPSREIQVI
jgi:HSP20 family protein